MLSVVPYYKCTPQLVQQCACNEVHLELTDDGDSRLTPASQRHVDKRMKSGETYQQGSCSKRSSWLQQETNG